MNRSREAPPRVWCLRARLIALAVACGTALPAPAGAQCDLVAYWRLNGDGTDPAGGNTLTTIGNVTFPAGRLNQAADMHGPFPSALEAPVPSTYDLLPSGFTVECWVRPRALVGSNPRLVRAGPPRYAETEMWDMFVCRLDCTQGKVGFGVRHLDSLTAFLVSNGTIDNGDWHHVAVVYDGSELQIYLDGTLDSSQSLPGLEAHVGGSTLTLGKNIDASDQLDGQIDDVRIWRVARTAAEIQGSRLVELSTLPGCTSLQFNSLGYSASETDAGATITVERFGDTSGSVGVSYATSDGTATAGADYTTTSGTLSWADGDAAPKSFSIPVLQDTQAEGNETVNLALSAPTGGATLGTSAATLTILDDDPPSLQFASGSFSASEGGRRATVTVTHGVGAAGAVTVSYATSDGSATSGSDYLPASGALYWASGDTAPITFSIPVLQDTSVETNETVNLVLSGPTGGATLGDPSAATLTILDDDSPPGSCGGPGAGFMGVYGDPEGTEPCIIVPRFSARSLYLWATLAGASAGGMTGVEFRIIMTSPAGYFVGSYTPPLSTSTAGSPLNPMPDPVPDPGFPDGGPPPPPGVDPVILGSPIDTTSTIDDPAGMNLAFPQCQVPSAERVFLGSISLFNLNGGPTDLIVTRKSPPSNPGVPCALFTLCDAPEFSLAPMRTISLFNGERVAFLAQIVQVGSGCTPTDSPRPALPARLTLLGNVPDPFNPTTEIQYSLPEATTVKVTICDVRGRVLGTVFDGIQSAGRQSARWDGRLQDGRKATSGVYFARIVTQRETAVERLTLIK